MVATKQEVLSYEQRLEIAFYHSNGKSYLEISSIIGCSKSTAFDVCKKFEKTRSVINLPRSGRSGVEEGGCNLMGAQPPTL